MQLTEALMVVLVVLFGGLLWSCTSNSSRITEAHSVSPLRIPSGVSTTAFHNDYPIPDRNSPPGDNSVSITPPA